MASTTYLYRNTVACLAHVIRLHNGARANGLPVPTLAEIGATRATDRTCQYCAIDGLAAADDDSEAGEPEHEHQFRRYGETKAYPGQRAMVYVRDVSECTICGHRSVSGWARAQRNSLKKS